MPATGYVDLQPVVDRAVDGSRLECNLVHIDEVLAQCNQVDLGPVGVRIGLQKAHDFLDGTEGILARHRRHDAIVAATVSMTYVRLVLGKHERAGGKDGAGWDHQEQGQALEGGGGRTWSQSE
jgi:hypothetical protein